MKRIVILIIIILILLCFLNSYTNKEYFKTITDESIVEEEDSNSNSNNFSKNLIKNWEKNGLMKIYKNNEIFINLNFTNEYIKKYKIVYEKLMKIIKNIDLDLEKKIKERNFHVLRIKPNIDLKNDWGIGKIYLSLYILLNKLINIKVKNSKDQYITKSIINRLCNLGDEYKFFKLPYLDYNKNISSVYIFEYKNLVTLKELLYPFNCEIKSNLRQKRNLLGQRKIRKVSNLYNIRNKRKKIYSKSKYLNKINILKSNYFNNQIECLKNIKKNNKFNKDFIYAYKNYIENGFKNKLNYLPNAKVESDMTNKELQILYNLHKNMPNCIELIELHCPKNHFNIPKIPNICTVGLLNINKNLRFIKNDIKKMMINLNIVNKTINKRLTSNINKTIKNTTLSNTQMKPIENKYNTLSNKNFLLNREPILKCLSNNSNKVLPLLDKGTPLNALELTEIGSILPKFKYKEEK